ncbi:MAG: beta-N-acetylhexosaminidase, partial [Deltaproteobacteria bacterium]|nr:beta-N-acetylhexosaminidase [Deltaproteobacteria bacterium]
MNPTLDLADLDRWIGRLFMAGMPGTSLDPGTESLIRSPGVGGIILFSRNIESPLQLFSLCRDLQQASMKYQGSPLFLAVDQEGGRVARLPPPFPPPFTQFEGNEAMGADGNPVERVKAYAEITAREMRLVGLNMNLAPVVDVPVAEPEKHLRGRTFGRDPAKAASLGSKVVEVLQENGVMAVAKHFPGLGRATRDPHKDLPVIDADREEMETVHLPPFQAAANAGVAAVMTSHALYPALDP